MRARLAALLTLLLLAGCGQLPPPDEPSRPTRTASTSGSDGPEGTDTPEEFANDIEAAQRVAEEYWKQVFSKQGQSFRPVREVFPYEREGEVSCGRDPLPRNNAAYCSAGDFIAYDVNWAFGVFQQIEVAPLRSQPDEPQPRAIDERLEVRVGSDGDAMSARLKRPADAIERQHVPGGP